MSKHFDINLIVLKILAEITYGTIRLSMIKY